MKIGGVVSDYKEALDIEDAVKVFIIEQRILNLLSLERKKKIKKEDNSNAMIFLTDDEKFSEKSNGKLLSAKIIDYQTPIFSVRGLV